MFAVEVGARSTRKGARLHVANGCRWANVLPLVGKLVELTAANAHRCCGNCRKAIRTAIDTLRTLASRAQGYGRAVAHQARVGLDILAEAFAVPVTVEQIVTAPGHDEGIARIEAVHAEFWAPVEVETVPEPVLSKLGQVARNLGVVPNQAQPITVTRKSQRGRLALHRSFAHAA